MVTVDCGISDAEEVAWAKAEGLEVIITDHHEIPPELPDALAVVNPKRAGHAYPFSELAGVGVALLLALGVRADLRAEGWFRQRPEPNLRSYLDLVALGTAADVVPLVGENRILVSQGLKVLEESRRPGIIALKEVTQLEGKPISYQNVVFQLAPRLNAAGRMGQARCALELLLSDDLAQARVQARYLHNLNRQRQALEGEVLKQAEAMIRRRKLAGRPVLVLAGEGWHSGVIDDILAFLDPSLERLNPPFELPDLEVAAARLGRAVRQGEPVAVYGDYDADGITATSLLHQFLRELGLPSLHPRPANPGLRPQDRGPQRAGAQGPAGGDGGLRHEWHAEVAWAKAQGLEVIITDHHEIPPELPAPWPWSIPSGPATPTPR